MSDGNTTWTYIYDSNGMRTQRTNGTTTYNYVYSGSQLSWMTVSDGTVDIEMHFTYDASGRPLAVKYGGVMYYYALNLQGDVVAILNSSGSAVVYYTYDAWGNPLTISGSMVNTLGEWNPLRYRGYVYDQDTGLYYLQSRYYNPEWGRFINADSYTSTGQGTLGNNMFVYCGNNPVSRADNGGEFWQVVAGAAVGAALGAISEIAAQLINQAATGEAVDWGDVAISALGGAVYGGVMAATGSTVVASVASTVTTSVATGIKDGDPVEKIILDTVKETTIAAVTSAAPKIINKSLSGKYLKLNKFQQWLKDATADPFRGKYTREGNYLPYVFDEGLEDLRDSIAKSTIQALQSLN